MYSNLINLNFEAEILYMCSNLVYKMSDEFSHVCSNLIHWNDVADYKLSAELFSSKICSKIKYK